MLATAYHMTVRAAQADAEQVSPVSIDASGINSPMALMSNGGIFQRDHETGTWSLWSNPLDTIGGSHNVLDFVRFSGRTFVVLGSGDVWVYASTPGGDMWIDWGNVFGGGPIAVDPATMGNVKAKYKDEEDE